MSLFGGDGAFDRQFSPENDFPVSSSFPDPTPLQRCSPPVHQSHDDEDSDLQDAKELSHLAYDVDDEFDEDYTESEEEEDLLGHVRQKARPNRFAGKAPTWRGYTAQDRNIATSLDQIQAEDLAAHLYDAHALTRRARLPDDQLGDVKNWQSRDGWMKKGRDLVYTDIAGERQTEFVPPKRWTAWPLPADEVPGLAGGEGERAREAAETAREEILACFLRVAKERFSKRKAGEGGEAPKPKRRKVKAQSRARSRSTTAGPSDNEEESDIEREEPRARSRSRAQSESEMKWAHILEAGKKAQQVQGTRPVVSADDDASRRILQPTINSLLARVDALATGIRQTRMNHFGRGAYSDSSGSEATSGGETDRSSSRSRSRSLPRSTSASANKPPSRTPRRSKAAPKSRAKKQAPDSENDSGSDYGAEHGSDESEAFSDAPSSTSSRAGRSGSVSSGDGETSAQVGLMDWSEILSLASIASSFPPAAIARTAQRCAALFGEGMSFRVFDERFATASVPPLVDYRPATIPAPPLIDPRTSVPKRPLFEVGTLRCPHPDCRYHDEDFKIPYRAIEHVIRSHGYDPRTNDSDNEERKMGGVHVDGFLMPITAKQGWLGRGRGRSASNPAATPAKARRPRSRSVVKKFESEEVGHEEVGQSEEEGDAKPRGKVE